MKKEYNIKDQVWIHLGEPKLVDGRVVDIIDLSHLKEGHNPDRELYIIEIKTGIEDIYEVRDFNQISPDARGPINLFRKRKDAVENNRLLKKIGMPAPLPTTGIIEAIENLDEELEMYPDEGDAGDPTPEQIHAAMERAEKARDPIFNPHVRAATKRPAKKRTFTKRKKNDSNHS